MTTRPSTDAPTADAAAGIAVREDEGEALAAAGVLARAAAAFRHALDDVHEADDEAWAAYSRSLDDATRRLQAELLVARAQLDTERAHRPEIVHDAVASAGDALQERIDTLRVQAHLGRREVEEGVAHTLEDIERRAAEVRDAARRARFTTTSSVEEARHAARVVFDDIVELLRVAGSAVRDDVPPDRTGAGVP